MVKKVLKVETRGSPRRKNSNSAGDSNYLEKDIKRCEKKKQKVETLVSQKARDYGGLSSLLKLEMGV